MDSLYSSIFSQKVYKIARATPLLYEDFGLWKRDGGLVDSRTTRILSRRRRNLQGHQFKATTVFLEKGSEKYMDLDDYQ